MATKKEVYCQQVLQPEGTVFSVQWVDVPKPVAAGVDARSVMERYFAFIRTMTFAVVRPTVAKSGGVEFRFLSSSLSLLTFAPPRYECERKRTAVHLDMVGGKLVQSPCGRGLFSMFTEEMEDSVKVTVRLDGFRPALLGCATPTLPRRLLYRLTQASVHKWATIAFLMRFYREVTGVKVHPEVKPVQLREGVKI
ncbi:hypothetical protein LPW11_11715 [Geomonas sp. RF6]|uniref:hypothetical protein n=1 Tax=Geomonas sp. RF6 TaxID=2897342 RepID=UPI001E37300E|nr:hypothetical protein [Geomonas sp. RF6]UFS68584.1 hypothetical protein LPW11_11715 [Geomonas sp. RF6]